MPGLILCDRIPKDRELVQNFGSEPSFKLIFYDFTLKDRVVVQIFGGELHFIPQILLH